MMKLNATRRDTAEVIEMITKDPIPIVADQIVERVMSFDVLRSEGEVLRSDDEVQRSDAEVPRSDGEVLRCDGEVPRSADEVPSNVDDLKTQETLEERMTVIVAEEAGQEKDIHHIIAEEATTSKEDSMTRKKTTATTSGASETLRRILMRSRPIRTSRTLACLASSRRKRIKSTELLLNTRSLQKRRCQSVDGAFIHSKAKLLSPHFTFTDKAHI